MRAAPQQRAVDEGHTQLRASHAQATHERADRDFPRSTGMQMSSRPAGHPPLFRDGCDLRGGASVAGVTALTIGPAAADLGGDLGASKGTDGELVNAVRRLTRTAGAGLVVALVPAHDEEEQI